MSKAADGPLGLAGPACAPGAGLHAKPIPVQELALRPGLSAAEREWPGRSQAPKTTHIPLGGQEERPQPPAQTAASRLGLDPQTHSRINVHRVNPALCSCGAVKSPRPGVSVGVRTFVRVQVCVSEYVVCECVYVLASWNPWLHA